MGHEYVIGMEKAESLERVLVEGAAKETVYYWTQYRRRIENYSILQELLDEIKEIDFQIVYFSGTNTEDYIYNLRERYENATEKKEKNEILKSLKELDPSTEIKLSIIVDNLMEVAEKRKCGIGIINGIPYYYNGCYWEALTEEFVQHYLIAVVEKSGLPHFQASKVKLKDLLYKQFVSTAAMPQDIPSDKKVMINLKNGTFVCEDGMFEIRPFSPEDRLTYQLPFNYDPEAEAPKFIKFLNEVIPEEKARTVISEYIGYIFAKHLRWEKCLVLLGSGGNGKSVLIDIITALLGEQNVCHFSLSRLCDSNGYYRAELGNYLLNACSEMGAKNCDPEMVKQLFSNDPVGARSPYGKPITVSRYCRFLFSANIISNKDMEQSYGYFRRFLHLEFNAPISKEKMNTNLAKEIIQEELSGVFNWALEGLKSILQEGRNGFSYSPHIEKTNKEIEKNSNNVALFIEENDYRPSSTDHTEAKELYMEYQSFCQDFRYGAVSKTEFLRRLEDRQGIIVKRRATNNATWVFCTKFQPNADNINETQSLVKEFVDKGLISSNS